jgi:hypothetical protein
MSWAAIGSFVARWLTQAALEKFLKGVQEKAEPKA